MKNKLKTLNTILLTVFCLLTLFILGAEPTDLYNFNEQDYLELGTNLCITWSIVLVMLITSIILTVKTKEN